MPLGIGGTGASRATNDPFYRPGAFQQDADFDWTKTPVIGGPTGYLEQNQDASYNRWLSNLGYGQANQTPYADWLRRQFQETQLGFKTALAENPLLTYQNYLQKLSVPNLRLVWRGLSPRQRGEYPSRFGGPVRTIADI